MSVDIRDIRRKSLELFNLLKEFLKEQEADGVIIELANAISKWEEMDYFILAAVETLESLRVEGSA